MLLKTCNRCGRLMPYGTSYCEVCTPIVEEYKEARRLERAKAYNKEYNKSRDPKYTKFYNSVEWKTLSLRYLMDKRYQCEECRVVATEVHHKIPIQTPEGWELRLDYENLESLCIRCHNKRHGRFMNKRQRKSSS